MQDRPDSSCLAPTVTCPFVPPPPGSLGAIIGAFKSTTTRLVNGIQRTFGASLWQRNYYEHIIRDEADLERIRVYIRNNPMNPQKRP